MGIRKQFVHTCESCCFEYTTWKEQIDGWGYVQTQTGHDQYFCPRCIGYRREIKEYLDRTKEQNNGN